MNADEQAIRAVEAAYDAAWNAGDIDALVGCFTDDAIVVNPRGDAATGLDDIRTKIGGFITGEARGSTHEGRIDRITFVHPDVAMVDGEATLAGGALTAPMTHRFTDVLIRRDGRWLIGQVRAYGLGG